MYRCINKKFSYLCNTKFYLLFIPCNYIWSTIINKKEKLQKEK